MSHVTYVNLFLSTGTLDLHDEVYTTMEVINLAKGNKGGRQPIRLKFHPTDSR